MNLYICVGWICENGFSIYTPKVAKNTAMYLGANYNSISVVHYISAFW